MQATADQPVSEVPYTTPVESSKLAQTTSKNDTDKAPQASGQVASAAGLAFFSKTCKAGCSSTMTGPAAALA
jgi:hypothetical protein